MLNDKSPPESETIAQQETGGDCVSRLVRLESALGLALHILGAQEPPDSRAVSDEFVAMASVLAGCESAAAMEIIAAGMNIPREYTSPEIEIISLPNACLSHGDGSATPPPEKP